MNSEMIAGTLDARQAADRQWDVLVIGGGPSGAIAARECARSGASVLLVDRSRFPRRKVCGCCLNGAALGVLEQLGLGQLPNHCGAVEINYFKLASRRRFATVPISSGVSLSRERLDAELIAAAVGSGADFLDNTQAMVGDHGAKFRKISLRSETGEQQTLARMVVVAAGLGNRVFLDRHSEGRQTDRNSRIGAGTILDSAPDDYQPGTIYMACHRQGYVGLVYLEDGRFDIAAALDCSAVKALGGIGPLAEKVIRHSGFRVPDGLGQTKWQGTAKLTQMRQQVYGERFLVVGDAAGYVEPFTGEGMAWGLASGRAVAPFVIESLDVGTSVSGPQWAEKRTALLHSRMRLCRTVSRLLRYPTVVSIAAWGLSLAPRLAAPVVKSLNKSFALH